MARTVAIGEQRFEEIIANNYFYVDKIPIHCRIWSGHRKSSEMYLEKR